MGNNSVCIFAESGEYVKFHNMLSITMASVANDMEVNIFFSYGALEKLKKEKLNEMSFNNQDLKNMFNNAINSNKIQNIEQIIETLRETGLVKFYVCSASLNIMNINENDLFVFDGIMGL